MTAHLPIADGKDGAMPSGIPEDRRAPEGMIWQCAACGKRAEDQYGIVGWHSYGWDESCMLHAAAVPDLRGEPA